MEFFFGTVTRYDGTEYRFDPFGPLSILSMARRKTEGKFPEAESWSKFDGRVLFEGSRMLIRWESKHGNAS